MARFYNRNVMAMVCGKPVQIRHSQTYPTIQVSLAPVASALGWTSGTSADGMSGCVSLSSFFELMKTSPRVGATKVVYVSQLPNTKYKEEDVLQLAESFGKVQKYFLNRIRGEVISTSCQRERGVGYMVVCV